MGRQISKISTRRRRSVVLVQRLLEHRAHLDVVLGHHLPDAPLVVFFVGAHRSRVVQKELPPSFSGYVAANLLPLLHSVKDFIGGWRPE